MLAVPQPFAGEGIGHVLLFGEVAGIVVGVFVSVVIAQFFHQLRGSIADGQWHGLVARPADEVNSSIDTQVG